ncbi:hypothetical protein HJG60_007999 [Phyllostomus discolor]|uniref:Uncharacterized protein n=1 Tax=Phyllostomus discolor TaxID=89673 RepID=A0A834BN39_9CHIR|nr:hypothetical protein HJG60_007999 [Phyllostomus discolor]
MVNKITWVSSVQIYNTSSVYCTVCVHYSKSRFLLSPFIRPLPSSPSPVPFPPVITKLLNVSMRLVCLLNPFTFFIQPLHLLPLLTAVSLFSVFMHNTLQVCDLSYWVEGNSIFVRMGKNERDQLGRKIEILVLDMKIPVTYPNKNGRRCWIESSKGSLG